MAFANTGHTITLSKHAVQSFDSGSGHPSLYTMGLAPGNLSVKDTLMLLSSALFDTDVALLSREFFEHFEHFSRTMFKDGYWKTS